MSTASRVRAPALLVTLLPAAAVSAHASPALQEQAIRLATIKRLCVDKITGEESAAGPARELAIAALFAAQRFTVTENCAKADAILRGAVMERGDKRVRAEGEAADFGAAAGAASVSRSGGSAGFGAIRGGSGESLYSAETRSTASVVLRLVDSEGTVIWACTQDSAGGKTKGAVPDAVDRAVRQLLRDLERSLKPPDSSTAK